ncbi:MAG: hydrogenase nickel incorporation protein HypA [Candidatus Methanoplasma sp.]|jgi:hypothetical protein|nr:hydrogenase nickel incorporation protein HypA [Candidatus Methanoplasma sp.]
MSGHHHDEGCHCKECEDKKNGESTSIEEAGGVAVGLTGHIHGYNADVAARFSDAILTTGKWVESESGSLLGHIKAAVCGSEGNGITLNLTDTDNGVEMHGSLSPCEKADFTFMSAVLDVDSHDLEHVMIEALEESGIDYHLIEHHHDHHDHGHADHDHGNGGGHHHDHHGHGHTDHDHGDGACHCKACEDRRDKTDEGTPKGSFWNKIRRRKK